VEDGQTVIDAHALVVLVVAVDARRGCDHARVEVSAPVM
jgi:hypothetical protein